MNNSRLSPEDYLKRPYTRQIIPDEESGTYTARMKEFPGCITQGNTEQEAYGNLEDAAKNWIEAALDLGQEIPPPLIEHEFSGKFALRLPKSLHRQATLAAEREGTSLNQFIIYAVSEKVGVLNLYREIANRVTDNMEFYQQKFQRAFNRKIEQIEYAIQEQADTSQSRSAFEAIIRVESDERRVH